MRINSVGMKSKRERWSSSKEVKQAFVRIQEFALQRKGDTVLNVTGCKSCYVMRPPPPHTHNQTSDLNVVLRGFDASKKPTINSHCSSTCCILSLFRSQLMPIVPNIGEPSSQQASDVTCMP